VTYLQLVYISTMRAPVSPAECEAILAASRRNNGRDGITGLLVVGTTRFLQLLEGPPAAVRSAYARIKADPRHYAAVVVSERQVEDRDCPEWAMGYLPSAPTVANRSAAPRELVESRTAKAGMPSLGEGHVQRHGIHSHDLPPSPETLQALVERLAAPIANKNVRAQFTGFAEVQAKAA
jgi:hypothetical protein